MGVEGGGGVVLALVEECARLLTLADVEMKADAVHGEDGGGLVALEQAGRARRQLFQFPDVGIDALGDGSGLELLGKLGEQCLANRFGVHGLGEDLQRKDVVVAVDDQAG